MVKTWLSNAGSAGSIPDQGTKIPHAAHHGQNKKIKRNGIMKLKKKRGDPKDSPYYIFQVFPL